jgi:hypothetical protein
MACLTQSLMVDSDNSTFSRLNYCISLYRGMWSTNLFTRIYTIRLRAAMNLGKTCSGFGVIITPWFLGSAYLIRTSRGTHSLIWVISKVSVASSPIFTDSSGIFSGSMITSLRVRWTGSNSRPWPLTPLSGFFLRVNALLPSLQPLNVPALVLVQSPERTGRERHLAGTPHSLFQKSSTGTAPTDASTEKVLPPFASSFQANVHCSTSEDCALQQ